MCRGTACRALYALGFGKANFMSVDAGKIDWAALGNADVPAYIEDLCSEERARQIGGYNQINGNFIRMDYIDNFEDTLDDIVHNSLQHQLVIALIEILKNKTFDSPQYILNLLIDFVHLGSYIDEGTTEQTKQRILGIRKTVGEQIDTYFALLDHPQPRIRILALHLLGYFPNQYAESMDRLIRFSMQETDIAVKNFAQGQNTVLVGLKLDNPL
jgi:hypothetical protein